MFEWRETYLFLLHWCRSIVGHTNEKMLRLLPLLVARVLSSNPITGKQQIRSLDVIDSKSKDAIYSHNNPEEVIDLETVVERIERSIESEMKAKAMRKGGEKYTRLSRANRLSRKCLRFEMFVIGERSQKVDEAHVTRAKLMRKQIRNLQSPSSLLTALFRSKWKKKNN